MDLSTLKTVGDFGTWLGTSGVFVLVMSMGLEKIPGWENWSVTVKKALSILVAFLLGLASAALVKWLPSGVRPGLEDIYQVGFNAASIWVAATMTHDWFSKRKAVAAKELAAPAPILVTSDTGTPVATPPSKTTININTDAPEGTAPIGTLNTGAPNGTSTTVVVPPNITLTTDPARADG